MSQIDDVRDYSADLIYLFSSGDHIDILGSDSLNEAVMRIGEYRCKPGVHSR